MLWTKVCFVWYICFILFVPILILDIIVRIKVHHTLDIDSAMEPVLVLKMLLMTP